MEIPARLPGYVWECVEGFTPAEQEQLQEMVCSTARLTLRFAQEGGFDSTASF